MHAEILLLQSNAVTKGEDCGQGGEEEEEEEEEEVEEEEERITSAGNPTRRLQNLVLVHGW